MKKQTGRIEPETRRAFLKNSSFAAYAAPAITLLVIESAVAKNSGKGGDKGKGKG